MILTVPLVGEIKSFPLNETFRMSFGAPTFSFLLLFRRIPAFYRVFNSDSRCSISYLNGCHYKGNMDWLAAFHTHYPSFSFYFTYSYLFHLAKIKRFYHQPLMIGFIGCMIEILSDCVELMIQYFVLKHRSHPRQ